jgi:antitoxin (DNA-binding transcriptional repressor) of toxin-antitoxin stability system
LTFGAQPLIIATMTTTMTTPTISKGKLKARMLEIFREIEAGGQEWIVTDNGKPVLKIVPIMKDATVEEIFGHLRDKVMIYEDLTLPTIDEWDEA